MPVGTALSTIAQFPAIPYLFAVPVNPPNQQIAEGGIPSVSSPAELAQFGESVRGNRDLLLSLAHKYIWWLTPEEAMEYPSRVVAQVMNLGVFEDVSRLLNAMGDDSFRHVIRNAEAGQFSPMSWHYWHYRLHMAEVDAVPPMPVRQIPQFS